MSFIESLFTRWAIEDGLTLFHISLFDLPGEDLRLWWIFSGTERLSSPGGWCDEEALAFFCSSSHEISSGDFVAFERELYGHQINTDGPKGDL
jgi:hypothetical protein